MTRRMKPVKTKARPTKKKVKHIPDGYHTETPYLTVDNAAAAIEFYKKAFGAKEIMRMPGPGGKIGHAEIQIGNSRIMLADEAPPMGTRGPKALGGSPVSLMLYFPDVDKVFNRALAAGAKQTRPVKNQFYGDRSGDLEDPFGHKWIISTHIEEVPPKEMEKRMKAAMAGAPA
ncbi:MAG TPA: VOC family protein [bacterium]|nr:VOC family protein [bacterium]